MKRRWREEAGDRWRREDGGGKMGLGRRQRKQNGGQGCCCDNGYILQGRGQGKGRRLRIPEKGAIRSRAGCGGKA